MRTTFSGAWWLLLVCALGCGDGAAPGDGGTSDGAADGWTDSPCDPAGCRALDDACHFGVCDPVAARCVAAPRADGTVCDDGNVCTAVDVCTAGTCAGAPADDGVACELAQEACATHAACSAGACVGTFAPATTCATAPTILLEDGIQRIDGALDCVSAHHEASCGGAGSERLYRLVLAAPRRVRIAAATVAGGATDLVLSLREACAAPSSELACSAAALEATLAAGEHTLIVDSSGAGGAFAIDVDVLEPDGCAEEPELAIPQRAGEVTHVRGDTTGEGEGEFPTHFCNPTSSPDHVYRFVLTETSALRFRGEAGTTFDAYLTLLSGTCASPMAIACNDDGPTSSLPELEITLAPGEYHLVVTGVYTMSWGAYDVSITRL